MHTKHKIYNRTTQRKPKNTHTLLSLDGYGNRHDTSSLAESSSVTEEFSCSNSG